MMFEEKWSKNIDLKEAYKDEKSYNTIESTKIEYSYSYPFSYSEKSFTITNTLDLKN